MGLSVRNLSGAYGPVPVLRDVSIDVDSGEAVAILGRNGVGKTTLLRAIMGALPRTTGSIHLDGHSLSDLPTYRRARLGVAYVPQGRDIFPDLTVDENLRLGHCASGRSMSAPLPGELMEHFTWMRDRLRQPGGTLSGGQQQMLAIARALIAEPRVVLLDEPTEGLAPTVTNELAQLLRLVAARLNLAMLVVEQNAAFALSVAQRGYVMEKGQVVATGSASDLMSDEIINRHLTI